MNETGIQNDCNVHSSLSACSGVARTWYKEGAQNYMKVFVVHKTPQNNTPNEVHVAATVAEYKYVWRGNRTKSMSDFVRF